MVSATHFDNLPDWARAVAVWLKELGIIGLALLLCAYFIAKDAGWINDGTVNDHKTLIEEVRKQNEIAKAIQDVIKEQQHQLSKHLDQTERATRALCMAVSSDVEKFRLCNGS